MSDTKQLETLLGIIQKRYNHNQYLANSYRDLASRCTGSDKASHTKQANAFDKVAMELYMTLNSLDIETDNDVEDMATYKLNMAFNEYEKARTLE